MNIVVVNTSYLGSGCEKLARQVCERLIRRGHRVTELVGVAQGNGAEWVHPIPYLPLEKKAQTAFAIVTGLNDSLLPTCYTLPWREPIKSADVVHLFNMHGNYFALPMIGELAKRKPVVWTMVDMWAFTGTCAYSKECTRFITGCYDCPSIKRREYPSLTHDWTRLFWNLKRRWYGDSSIVLNPTTRWLEGLVRQSILKNLAVRQSWYGIDPEEFYPTDRKSARRALGIPANNEQVVVGLFHTFLLDPRKGIVSLLEAIASRPEAADARFIYFVLGQDSAQVAERFGSRLRMCAKNVVRRDDELNHALNALDILLYPTQAENLSLTTLDAMAAGVTVISTNVGGMSEAITDGENGFLVELGDHAAMVDTLLRVATDPKRRRRIGENARTTILRQFHIDRYVGEIEQVYGEAIARKGGK